MRRSGNHCKLRINTKRGRYEKWKRNLRHRRFQFNFDVYKKAAPLITEMIIESLSKTPSYLEELFNLPLEK